MAFDAAGDVRLARAHAEDSLPFAAPNEARFDWNKSDTGAASAADLSLYMERLFLPLGREGDHLVVALADTSIENLAWLHAAYGPLRIDRVSKEMLLREVQRRFEAQLTQDSIFSLAKKEPSLSARRVIAPGQSAALCLLALAAGVSLVVRPADTAWALVAAISLLLWLTVLFRAALALIGARRKEQLPHAASGHDTNLPLYTIIVPLYREAHMMPALSRVLLALDYPRDKLQIIVALEADDAETLLAAEKHSGLPPFEIVRVPPSHPRTKPKAANFALRFARGEFLVVFDAEDRPERDQLRKAVSEFRRQSRATACLQARLIFDNRARWLSIQSSIDYAVWFGFLLEGLDRLGIPMPLGGTSNHFRTSVLRAIHAWDPFNVTEDADVGIRLAALGYRVAMLDSSTCEEAPERIGVWIKQRSRWLKGYMQTWLVHSRCASAFVSRAGLRGFLGFHLFIGGTVLSALLNPILWAVCIGALTFGQDSSTVSLGNISAAGIVASNGLLTLLAVVGSAWRGDGRLSAHGVLVPVYWLLISAAAYRGLWQLITRPFYWEKTEHDAREHSHA